jgi:hypothetical protein
MNTLQTIKIVDQLREATSRGCSFISFLYTTKKDGSTSLYTINFGVDYQKACEHDKTLLEAYQPKNDLQVTAKAEMLKSLTETVTEGVSQAYTQKDTYTTLGKGIKIHNENQEIHLWGFLQSKTEIAPATIEQKKVNSRPLTIEKKNIERELEFKRNKFVSFVLNPANIAGIKVKGTTIEVQSV